MTISVPSGQTRSFALPLLHESVGTGAMRGKVGSVGTNFLDVPGASWSAGNLNTTTNPYYLRLRSGPSAGRTVVVASTPNTDSRVYVATDGVDLTTTGGPANGDGYEIVLADTLGTLFGSTTLQGGPDANSADNVLVWANTSWVTYYYNTSNSRWQRSTDTIASPPRDNFVLRPDRGFMITRRAPTTLTFYVMGRVPEVGGRPVHSRPGSSFLSLAIPADITIGDLAVNTRVVGWQTAADAAGAPAADRLLVWGNTSWVSYYLNTSGSWQRITDTIASPSRNSVVIPAGRPVMISRVDAGSGAATLVNLPINYTNAQ